MVTVIHPSRPLPLRPFAPGGDAVRALDARIREPRPGLLDLRYVLAADLSRLRVPAARTPRRRDGLWKHTCFELFVRAAPGSAAYCELNVSPSGEWALYAFDGYRRNMAPVAVAHPPRVRVTRLPGGLRLDVRADLRDLPHAGERALSAVIEDDAGGLGHWALRHPAPRPDFHHPGGFLLPP